MSQENVEIIKRCCEAFDRGDYETALRALDAEIEYDLRHFPDGRVYHGHEGVREAFRVWLGTWEEYRQEVSEFIDAGNEVVVCVREYGRGKGSGVSLARPTFGIWKLTDGRVVRIRFRSTKAKALEAVGLSE
jgi:ketosteroid isomerase-like protein